jgi:hypothetical protein
MVVILQSLTVLLQKYYWMQIAETFNMPIFYYKNWPIELTIEEQEYL